jgi:hypothetical protein
LIVSSRPNLTNLTNDDDIMSTEATTGAATADADAAAATATPGQEAYEEEHVHSVYEQIASHFSSTRYKVGNRIMFMMFSFLLSPINPSIHQSNKTYPSKIVFSLSIPECKRRKKGKKQKKPPKAQLFSSILSSHRRSIPSSYTCTYIQSNPISTKNSTKKTQNQVN